MPPSLIPEALIAIVARVAAAVTVRLTDYFLKLIRSTNRRRLYILAVLSALAVLVFVFAVGPQRMSSDKETPGNRGSGIATLTQRVDSPDTTGKETQSRMPPGYRWVSVSAEKCGWDSLYYWAGSDCYGQVSLAEGPEVRIEVPDSSKQIDVAGGPDRAFARTVALVPHRVTQLCL